MNNLITYADFKGNRNLPIDKDVTGFENNYIVPFQKEILIKLLGYDLYLAFEIGLDATPNIASEWIALRDGSTYKVDGIKKQNAGVKDIILNYVYCKWLSANFEQITGLGVQNATSDNATIISPENKITAAWNDMIKLYYQTYLFLTENETDYPNLETEQLRLLTYGF